MSNIKRQRRLRQSFVTTQSAKIEEATRRLQECEREVLKAALVYAVASDTYSDHTGFSEYEDGDEATRTRIEQECAAEVEATENRLRRASLAYRTADDNLSWVKRDSRK